MFEGSGPEHTLQVGLTFTEKREYHPYLLDDEPPPRSSQVLKLQVTLTSGFQLSDLKFSPEKLCLRKSNNHSENCIFFLSDKEQCECEGRPLVCSGSLAWVTKHTKNDWWALTPHQVTSESCRNITETDGVRGPISASPCTRA